MRGIRVAALVAAPVVLAGAVLSVEALRSVRRTYLGGSDAPAVAGRVGPPGEATRLVLLGDSTAAGVGATSTAGTVGAQLAARLPEPVAYDSVAVSGARAGDLAEQVDEVLREPPDLAVVLIGANDATHLTRLGHVRRDLRAAVDRLVDAGVPVVVGTCPELGTARSFDQPLRAIVGWRGHRVADAEAAALRGSGAGVVDLARLTGPAFGRDPDRYLSEDLFHPSDAGYGLWAEALAPAAREALKPAR